MCRLKFLNIDLVLKIEFLLESLDTPGKASVEHFDVESPNGTSTIENVT